jgi:hypothetical protein
VRNELKVNMKYSNIRRLIMLVVVENEAKPELGRNDPGWFAFTGSWFS